MVKKKLIKSKGDVAHKAAKIVLSGIPWIGGPVAELFNTVIAPPLAKRRDKWLESIYEGLKKLEEKIKGFKIENLKDNEMFITTVMHATQVAMRNHQKEKLDALKAAVLNATSPNAPEEDLQFIFLNWVDELTPLHIRTLKSFDYDLRSLIDIDDPKGVEYQSIRDLENRGLVSFLKFQQKEIRDDIYDPLMFEENELSKIRKKLGETTELGSKFIKFITSPIEDEEEEK